MRSRGGAGGAGPTADEHGTPWAVPLFFAPLTPRRLCWVSSPDSRHSRNIAQRPAVAITIFDSAVEVGTAEAAYFEAEAAAAVPDERDAALRALNARLPLPKRLGHAELQPSGPMVLYCAELRRSYLLVRGGNTEFGNDLDIRIEV